MSNVTANEIAEFLARGGTVKTISQGAERLGQLLEITEIPVGNPDRFLGTFRLRVHFNDTNSEGKIVCKADFGTGLKVGERYSFPTESANPRRHTVINVDRDITARYGMQTKDLKLVKPAIPA